MAIAFVLTAASCTQQVSELNDAQFRVFAHRGASGYSLENTMPSFKMAIEKEAKAVELDVFRCASGEIVVFHDDDLARLSNRQGSIEELSLEEINEVQLNGGYQIPILKDVLDLLFEHDILVNIELKGLNTAKGVMELINSYDLSDEALKDKIIISSFEWTELEEARQLNEQISIAVLTAENPVLAIDFANKVGALAINPNAADVSFSSVKLIHEAGLKVYTWTVNDEGMFKNLMYMGVDGVFSDYPDLAVAWGREIRSVVDQ